MMTVYLLVLILYFRRNDLIDLMMDALKQDLKYDINDNEHMDDQFEKDSELKNIQNITNSGTNEEEDELNLVATAVLIMVAGYDTTAQTLSYAGWQLSQRPDIQEKLHNEIDETFENSTFDGNLNLDYSKVQGMQYLDMFLQEVLRRYTPVGIINRVCTKNYHIKGTNVVIKKNQEVHIPIHGIMLDEK